MYVKEYILESKLKFELKAMGCIRVFLQTLKRLSDFALVFLGLILITAGVLSMVEAQRDPEGAFDQPPEGIFNIPFPEPVFAVLNPQAAFDANPEAVAVDPGPIQAIENAPPEPLEADYDDQLMRFGTGNLLMFIEGSFGALVMVGAGLGAIIAGAFGAYKAAISLLFVAVGAFILRALVSLFFGTSYDAYSAGGLEFVGGGL